MNNNYTRFIFIGAGILICVWHILFFMGAIKLLNWMGK